MKNQDVRNKNINIVHVQKNSKKMWCHMIVLLVIESKLEVWYKSFPRLQTQFVVKGKHKLKQKES